MREAAAMLIATKDSKAYLLLGKRRKEYKTWALRDSVFLTVVSGIRNRTLNLKLPTTQWQKANAMLLTA